MEIEGKFQNDGNPLINGQLESIIEDFVSCHNISSQVLIAKLVYVCVPVPGTSLIQVATTQYTPIMAHKSNLSGACKMCWFIFHCFTMKIIRNCIPAGKSANGSGKMSLSTLAVTSDSAFLTLGLILRYYRGAQRR